MRYIISAIESLVYKLYTLDRIARSLARQTGQREEDVTRQTWSRLAVTLQRANGQTLYFHVLPPYTMDL